MKHVLQKLLAGDTFGTVLLVAALDRFGTAVLTWDPTTVALEFESWLDDPLPFRAFNKLMAAATIVSTDLFFTDLPSFVAITNTLWDGRIAPEGDVATIEEAAWAVVEAILLWPPDRDARQWFHPEITAYLAEEMRREGLLRAPDILRDFVQDYSDLARLQDAMPDDPDMVSVMYQTQDEKIKDINLEIRERLATLFQHLAMLPLQHGDAARAAAKLQENLRRRQAEHDALVL